jgi:hypothetical protein
VRALWALPAMVMLLAAGTRETIDRGLVKMQSLPHLGWSAFASHTKLPSGNHPGLRCDVLWLHGSSRRTRAAETRSAAPDFLLPDDVRGWCAGAVCSSRSPRRISSETVSTAVARIVLEGVLDDRGFTAFDLPQLETVLYNSLPDDVRMAGLRSLLPAADPHLSIAATAMEFACKNCAPEARRASFSNGKMV